MCPTLFSFLVTSVVCMRPYVRVCPYISIRIVRQIPVYFFKCIQRNLAIQIANCRPLPVSVLTLHLCLVVIGGVKKQPSAIFMNESQMHTIFDVLALKHSFCRANQCKCLSVLHFLRACKLATFHLSDGLFVYFDFRIFIDAFKRRIESMVDRNSSRHIPDSNMAAIHDMAFYPLCKYSILVRAKVTQSGSIQMNHHFNFAGSKNNQTSWLEENTAKLYFSSNIFEKLIPNTFLHRATLR